MKFKAGRRMKKLEPCRAPLEHCGDPSSCRQACGGLGPEGSGKAKL